MEMINDTIGSILEKMAQRYPLRDALVHVEKGTRYTYQLLSWQVDRAALGLVAYGVKRGDHVALWAANIPEWLVSMLAIAKLGAVFVPIDPGAGSEDLKYILEQAECGVLMVSGELAEKTAAIEIPSLEHIIVISPGPKSVGIPWPELISRGETVNLKDPANGRSCSSRGSRGHHVHLGHNGDAQRGGGGSPGVNQQIAVFHRAAENYRG